jgi:hypothetical protein
MGVPYPFLIIQATLKLTSGSLSKGSCLWIDSDGKCFVLESIRRKPDEEVPAIGEPADTSLYGFGANQPCIARRRSEGGRFLATEGL